MKLKLLSALLIVFALNSNAQRRILENFEPFPPAREKELLQIIERYKALPPPTTYSVTSDTATTPIPPPPAAPPAEGYHDGQRKTTYVYCPDGVTLEKEIVEITVKKFKKINGVLKSITDAHKIVIKHNDCPEIPAPQDRKKRELSENENSSKLFPNPLGKYEPLYISSINIGSQVNITDITGKVIANFIATEKEVVNGFKVDNLNSGIYNVVISSSNKTSAHKLIVE